MFGGIVCIILMTIVSVNAAMQDFTQVYTYRAGAGDSEMRARELAQTEAKRIILERIGVGILSKTIVKDFKITGDVVTMLQAGIVSSEEVEQKWNGKEYMTTLKVKLDPDDVEKKLIFYIQTTKEDEAMKVKNAELVKENEKLKIELKISKSDTTIKRSEEVEREINDTALLQKGIGFFRSSNFKLALDNFDEIIKLYPKYADAYVLRGRTLYILGNRNQAVKDFDKAVELEPKKGVNVYYRGLAYDSLGNYESYLKAVADFKKALELETDPKGISFIRYYLGIALYHVGWCWNQGIHVPKNYENAAKIFSEADQYDNKEAQFELGILYMEGWGVQADKMKAYIFLNRAATQGNKVADAYRTLVSMNMTEAEIREAQRLSFESISEGERKGEKPEHK